MFKKNRFDSRKYNVVDASNMFVLTILLPFIVVITAAIYLGILERFANQISEFFNVDMNISVFRKILNLTIIQVTFLSLFFIYNRFKNIDWRKQAKFSPVSAKVIGMSILIGLFSLLFFYPIIDVFERVLYELGLSLGDLSLNLGIDLSSLSGYLIGVFAIAVLPAIGEEIVFRGVIFQGLYNSYNKNKAIIISALMFAIIHMSIFQTIYPLILGVVLAVVVYKTNSIWPAIVIHFTNNFAVLTLNFAVTNLTDAPEEAMAIQGINIWGLMFGIVMFVLGVFVIKGLMREFAVNPHTEKSISLKNLANGVKPLPKEKPGFKIPDFVGLRKAKYKVNSLYLATNILTAKDKSVLMSGKVRLLIGLGLGVAFWIFSNVIMLFY